MSGAALATTRVARTLAELDRETARLRAGGQTLALVPTMGALHEGHLALVAEARRRASGVVASVFVNPLQFDAASDLARYPRDEGGDVAKLARAGCDLVWMPSVEEMYPPGSETVVEAPRVAARWEGERRPGHFRGVATVCCRLFGQTGADVAMFGEKDWQQVQVVRRVARDLHLRVEIVAAPTVREGDGLAMSSRNRFLSAEERRRAPALHATLARASARIAAEGVAAPALAAAEAALRAAGMEPEYLALVDAESLEPKGRAPGRLLAAARLGAVRLLDNVAVP